MEGEGDGETGQQQQSLNSPAASVHGEESRRRRGGGGGVAQAGRKGDKGKWVGLAKTYLRLSRQPAWHDNPVTPKSMALQGGPHAPPRQLRSTTRSTVAPLVAPVHVARQSGAGATPALARPKGSDLQILFGVSIKILF
jgi:hypothetical protein